MMYLCMYASNQMSDVSVSLVPKSYQYTCAYPVDRT